MPSFIHVGAVAAHIGPRRIRMTVIGALGLPMVLHRPARFAGLGRPGALARR